MNHLILTKPHSGSLHLITHPPPPHPPPPPPPTATAIPITQPHKHLFNTYFILVFSFSLIYRRPLFCVWVYSSANGFNDNPLFMHLKERTPPNKQTRLMLCMYNCLYSMANRCLCFDVVLCLCCAFNVRTIAERVCKVSIIPTPFRSETPLVDAYFSLS